MGRKRKPTRKWLERDVENMAGEEDVEEPWNEVQGRRTLECEKTGKKEEKEECSFK